MDIPAPPQDDELRNIIEKLAVFVARNGHDFETMTKQKQRNNPRFGFLFGGEFFNYYMYRVTTEQAILKHKAAREQQQQQQGGPQGNNFGPGGFQNPMMNQQQQQPRYPGHPNVFEQARGPPVQGFDRGGFDPRPAMNFERHVSPGMQNFDRPQMNRMTFQPPRGPGPGNFGPGPGNFDRPSQPQSSNGSGPNFDIDQRTSFSQVPANFQDRTVAPAFSQNFPPPQAASQAPVVSVAPSQPPPSTPSINVEALQAQKQSLEEQIRQSEQNLAGQHQVLLAQQQKQIEDSIRIMQDAEIKQLATELHVNVDEFEAVLQPIVESCTKDAISSGKAWIFTHTSTQRHYQLVSQYLLRRTTDPEATFNKRLHIIYLINDVLHHCMRKGADDLQTVLENMVIPMFCHAKVSEINNPENTDRLDKLFALWEAKSSYVTANAVEKLRNYDATWNDYQTELLQRFATIVTQIATNINQTYEGYQNQHQLFCQHVNQNIKVLEQQIQQGIVQQQLQLQQQQQQQQQIQLQQQLQLQQLSTGMPPRMPNVPPGMTSVHPGMPSVPHGMTNVPPGMANVPPGMSNVPPGMPNVPPGMATAPPGIASALPGPGLATMPSGIYPTPIGYPNQGPMHGQGFPPGMDIPGPPGAGLFDLSKPPPGFGATLTPPPESDLIPKIEYYELPAGLMVPLVKPEDDNYKPVDPRAIRLPPPCPPSERLLQAVEAFYAPATHERPRDSEGWERLGLYEYFKSKNLARKQKEDDIREGRRKKSRSPTPIRRDSSPTTIRSPPRRRYQSKSPTPPRRRRSRSRSPAGRRKRNNRRSRSRSRSPEPLRRRSPTPPSFGTTGLGMERKLDESNKGHQLLKKMGWSGSGLGREEQGIEAPISGGEIRDKKDQYRGVGVNSMNDPFESYRKSKGQAFVERMRARAEERL